MYRTVETFHIGVQFVVADKQRFLSLTFIAEAAHAQTGRVRKIKTVVIKFGQRVFSALGEAFAPPEMHRTDRLAARRIGESFGSGANSVRF